MMESKFKLSRDLDLNFTSNHNYAFLELVSEFSINCFNFPWTYEGQKSRKIFVFHIHFASNAGEKKANTNYLVYNHLIIGRRGIKNLTSNVSLDAK